MISLNPGTGGGGKTSSPCAIEAELQKENKNCDKPPFLREGDRVSGGRFRLEKVGSSEGRRGSCLQEQADCNSDYLDKNVETPSTYGRGKEFQHDEGVLEIQGGGAHYNQRLLSLYKLVKILLTYLLTLVKNLVPSHQTPTPTLPIGEGELKNAFLVKGGGAKRRWDLINQKAAFTLAEVLITLGIIGVVAAMTMPTLINKTQNKQLQTAFKKAYSELSQATLFVAAEKGPDLQGVYATYNGDDYPLAEEIHNAFYKQMKMSGTCKYKEKVRNYNKTSDNVYIDRGTPTPDKALANGMCFNVKVCSSNINLTIDINGTKKPNILGHDIFFFQVKNDVLKPVQMTAQYTDDELGNKWTEDQFNYSTQDGNPCSSKSNQRGNGLGCAYYALMDENPDDNTKSYWDNLP